MRRPGAAIVLLVLLVIADAVLVTSALRSTRVDPSQLADAATVPADTGTSTTTGTDSTSVGGSNLQAAGKVIVAGLTKTRAWRAVSDSMACSAGAAPATIAHSEDSGGTWTRVTVPMTTVSGLSYADGSIIATGLDRSCKPTTYALQSHSAPRKAPTPAGWTIDPEDLTKLDADGTAVTEQPCTDGIVDIATNSATNVVALCADGSVQHSTDAGRLWKEVTGKGAAIAIATGSASGSVYVASRAACGVSVLSMPAGTNACIDGTQDWTGPLDITVVANTMWLVSGTKAATQAVSALGS